jgi:hypothetical protein
MRHSRADQLVRPVTFPYSRARSFGVGSDQPASKVTVAWRQHAASFRHWSGKASRVARFCYVPLLPPPARDRRRTFHLLPYLRRLRPRLAAAFLAATSLVRDSFTVEMCHDYNSRSHLSSRISCASRLLVCDFCPFSTNITTAHEALRRLAGKQPIEISPYRERTKPKPIQPPDRSFQSEPFVSQGFPSQPFIALSPPPPPPPFPSPSSSPRRLSPAAARWCSA